jgi:hypothetical protein
MPDEDSFGDFFRSFTEGITGGKRVSGGGLFRYRQGGDLKNWSNAGTKKYLPGDWHIQAGCCKWTGAAAVFGMVELTFPIPFADAPIIVCQPTNTNPGFERCVCQPTVSGSGIDEEVYWWSDNNLTRVDIRWIAFGPTTI